MRAARRASVAIVLAGAVACGTSEGERSVAQQSADAGNRPATGGAASARSLAAGSGAAASPIPLATMPRDPCAWISVEEAERIAGPFAEPPRPARGGCLYTLTIPPEMEARRAKIAAFNKAIGSTLPEKREPYAFVLVVRVDEKTGERAMRLAGAKMAGWLGDDRPDSTAPPRPRPARADSSRPSSHGWDATLFGGGRLGTVSVTAISETSELALPHAKVHALTARVRDLVPDLPFPFINGVPTDAPDPCVLLSRQDVEPVLGALVVPPYRSANHGPLAHAKGNSCSYYTAKHHVLIVTPHWSDGEFELKAARGIGNLMGAVLSDTEATSADTIEGTWDETAITADGRLLLRKGDRAVEIEYETSSTDKAGALKLGRIAVERLARVVNR